MNPKPLSLTLNIDTPGLAVAVAGALFVVGGPGWLAAVVALFALLAWIVAEFKAAPECPDADPLFPDRDPLGTLAQDGPGWMPRAPDPRRLTDPPADRMTAPAPQAAPILRNFEGPQCGECLAPLSYVAERNALTCSDGCRGDFDPITGEPIRTTTPAE